MGTVNIGFEGQTGRSTMKIDRAMPSALQNYMSTHEWQLFCDNFDRECDKVMEFRRAVFKRLGCVAQLPFLVMILLVVVSVADVPALDAVKPGNPGFFAIVALFPIVAFGGVFWFLKSAQNDAVRLRQSFENVCQSESAKRSDLNFTLKDYQQLGVSGGGNVKGFNMIYIECTGSSLEVPYGDPSSLPPGPFGNNNLFANMAGQTAPPVAQPMYSSNGGGGSAAQRLAELDKIKTYMTEEEYNQKRSDIISSV